MYSWKMCVSHMGITGNVKRKHKQYHWHTARTFSEGAKRPSGGRVWEGGVPFPR